MIHINTLKYGIEITKVMNTTWFGQPAGVCILNDIKEGKLNFLVNWMLKGIATMEQASLIRQAYYSIDTDETNDTLSEEYKVILKKFNEIYIH